MTTTRDDNDDTDTHKKKNKSSRLLPLLLLKPRHYALHYKRIDLKHFRFEGTVAIDCTMACACDPKEVEKEVSSITLHALDLEIVKASLSCSWSSEADTHDDDDDDDEQHQRRISREGIEFRYKRLDQTCEIVFDEKPFVVLDQNCDYCLTIDFFGCLNDQMVGLYRSSYLGMDGKTHYMATTQFEPTEARRAFPCFDEPSLKATFALTVSNIPSHLQCISNTPIASSHTTGFDKKNGGALKTVTFQTTPKMSTYLVALIVGQLDGISRTSRQIVTTVYTVPGKAHQAHFCLDTAVRCLDLFQDLFKVPYPLVKSDLIAIPDFASGAMENWGCVTYREAKILIDDAVTSESMRRGIARTLCHELAHQWFGNLVTPEFWTQLWLKEGAARFFEFVAIDKLFPKWNAWTEFVQSVHGLALGLDAMESSHPVEVEVHHPDDINEIFDAISYAKGASIIRMIYSYIGTETFFEGMCAYLKRHAYGNAVTNDVWGALQEVSGVPVVEFMGPWTLQVGFPILELDNEGNIRMSRFLASGRGDSTTSTSSSTTNTARWPVPVTAIVQGINGVQGPWVLNGPGGKDESKQLGDKIKEWSTAGKWFKLNADQTGFFRVSYSDNQWKRLAGALNSVPSSSNNDVNESLLSTSDRLGLVSDSFSAGKAGYSSIVASLELIADFGNHEVAEYAVWEELSEHLTGIASVFRSEPFYPNLQNFLKQVYSRQMETLGWDAVPREESRTATLRATVIGMMGLCAGDEDICREAFRRLEAYTRDPTGAPIVGDLQGTLFRCALKRDEPKAFDCLKTIYERSNFPEEQRNALSAMGCVQDSKRHTEMLDYTVFSGKVRLQDASFPLAFLSGASDAGGRAAWKFFKDNYDRLHTRMGSSPTMWAGCVGLCCRGLRSAEEADEVDRFFMERPPGSAQRRLTQAMEIVRVQIRRRERDRDSLERFLRNYSSSAS